MTSIGTRLHTWLSGLLVGTDEAGNRYYRERRRGRGRRERRWVIYEGDMEASRVPPDWHGWLHHIVAEPPTERLPAEPQPWEQAHQPNLTGTDAAYRPPGHALQGGARDKATGDYEAWQPE